MAADPPVPTEKDGFAGLWDAIARELPAMGERLSRFFAEMEAEVPSGLSRESNPASTERTTP